MQSLQGRDGKGSIYVFAAGNGGFLFDSCAADGYTQSIHTISIGALTSDGSPASYDERCSAKMASTFVNHVAIPGLVMIQNNNCCFCDVWDFKKVLCEKLIIKKHFMLCCSTITVDLERLRHILCCIWFNWQAGASQPSLQLARFFYSYPARPHTV